MLKQDVVQLPYALSDAMPREQVILAVDRNLKEVERMLSILQLYMKQTGKPAIEDVGQVITRNEAGDAVIDPNKLADKMVGLNHALQIAERAVGALNLALDAVQPENMSAEAIKAVQPQWATHALSKGYAAINNSPLAGYIAWQNVKVTYKGEEYSVIDGNTDMRYAWWDFDYPTVMQTANNLPELTNDDVLVFYNKFGAALIVPGATVFDGGLVVPGTITADALAVACILAKHIGVGEILAEHIKAGEITTELVSADGLLANIIRGGTLTLGGYNNVNGLFVLLNALGKEIVRADNTGLSIGAGMVGGNDVADLETKNGAQSKATAAEQAAKTHAEQKAAEAQAAAEAVARAEATLAEANAEAYADSVVTAEEQARIDQAAANLAAAKTHAEEKAAAAEQAAKAYAEPEIYKSPVEPADKTKLWIDTSVIPNVFKRWDATAAAWIKTAPTEASEIGAETPEGAQTKADAAAAEAQAAAEAVAKAEADLAETQAKAYADGIVSDEEQARIQDAQAKLTEAKNHAETKASQAQSAAQAYAQQKAQEAQAAAEAVARAEATLAQTNAEAHADGKVSAEEQARIDQAAANLAAAKTHAETKASEAEVASKAYTDAVEVGGRNLIRNSDFSQGLVFWNTTQSTCEVVNGVMEVVFDISTSPRRFYYDLLNLKSFGTDIAISADIKADRPDNLGLGQGGNTKGVSVGTEWGRYSVILPYDSLNNLTLSIIYVGTDYTNKFYIDNLKLEKGNKPTDWTPAPEDVDQALADHDANPSPHNLPSYAKMEPTGFKVYDDKGNLRTHNGQYAPGEFGNWVDAGYYVLRDKGMDMSLEQLPNLLPDHSFECLNRDGSKCGYSLWEKTGSPELNSVRQTDMNWTYGMYGLQCVITNSSNYYSASVWRTRSTNYFVSGFAARGDKSPSAGTARIKVECWKRGETMADPPITLQTFQQDFPLNSTLYNYKRVGFRFTIPSDTDEIRVCVLSADSNWVYWDGIQLVEGSKPVKYNPEDSLWPHFWPEMGAHSSLMASKVATNFSGLFMQIINVTINVNVNNSYFFKTITFPITYSSVKAVLFPKAGAFYGSVADMPWYTSLNTSYVTIGLCTSNASNFSSAGSRSFPIVVLGVK